MPQYIIKTLDENGNATLYLKTENCYELHVEKVSIYQSADCIVAALLAVTDTLLQYQSAEGSPGLGNHPANSETKQILKRT